MLPEKWPHTFIADIIDISFRIAEVGFLLVGRTILIAHNITMIRFFVQFLFRHVDRRDCVTRESERPRQRSGGSRRLRLSAWRSPKTRMVTPFPVGPASDAANLNSNQILTCISCWHKNNLSQLLLEICLTHIFLKVYKCVLLFIIFIFFVEYVIHS